MKRVIFLWSKDNTGTPRIKCGSDSTYPIDNRLHRWNAEIEARKKAEQISNVTSVCGFSVGYKCERINNPLVEEARAQAFVQYQEL